MGSIADPLPDEMQGAAVDVLVAISGRADKEAPLSQQKDFVAGALATTVGLMKVRGRGRDKLLSQASMDHDYITNSKQIMSSIHFLQRLRPNTISYGQ